MKTVLIEICQNLSHVEKLKPATHVTFLERESVHTRTVFPVKTFAHTIT